MMYFWLFCAPVKSQLWPERITLRWGEGNDPLRNFHKAIKLKGLTFISKVFCSCSSSLAHCPPPFTFFDPSPFTLFWHIPYTVYHNVIHIHSNEIARNQYHILHGVVRVYCVHRRLQRWMAHRYIIKKPIIIKFAWYWTILSGVPNMPQTTIAGCQDITDNGDSALPPCLPMSDFTWVCSLYSASSSPSSSNHPYYRVILLPHTQLEVWWVASLANTSMYIFLEGLVCLLPLYGMSLAVSYQLHPLTLSWYVIHL